MGQKTYWLPSVGRQGLESTIQHTFWAECVGVVSPDIGVTVYMAQNSRDGHAFVDEVLPPKNYVFGGVSIENIDWRVEP